MPPTYTTGDLARLFNLPAWQINRVIRRGFLAEPHRIGCYRVFTSADPPRVREALIAAGYLDAGEVPA